MYGRYLRSESYRKALVWQKRYLLVHITGGYLDAEPVLRISRELLAPEGRFRAAVYAVIAVSRMRYLVRRWSSGKRAGARLTPTPGPLARPWSVLSNSAPEAVATGGVRRRPDSLSLHSSHSVLGRASNGSATPPTPHAFAAGGRRSAGQSIRRSASLREPETAARERSQSVRCSGLSRGGTERERSTSLLRSPSSLSSSSSQLQQPPLMTGRTPPTRDTAGFGRRNNGGIDSPAGVTATGIRRSLDSQFHHLDFARDGEIGFNGSPHFFRYIEIQAGV
jgi:hypothetical protein